MDELKNRAGEKLEALQVAAKTAADNGKSRLHDAVYKTTDAVRSVHKVFHDLWNNELMLEMRARARAWTDEAVRRVREGAPPLSPVLLYEELVALWHDRVWRRSVMIFACGVLVGGSAGVLVGLRMSRPSPAGPHSRALHSHADQTVILVDDSIAPATGPGEVLVRVQAFSVCVVDRGVLRGRASMLRSLVYRGHVTVGRGFSGVVLDVGQGVTEFELGDEVWGCVSEWSGGAATELLIVRSTRISKRPIDLPADDAASLIWSGIEALIALRKISFTPSNSRGIRVAVCGASAGPGCALVQLLSAWGARVTVAAHRHAALTLQNLGSEEFVDMAGFREGPLRGLEERAIHTGPWDAVLVCPAAELANAARGNSAVLLRATAPRKALLDLRPSSLITDHLPYPLSFLFSASFYGYRILRWVFGYGSDTDWLEDRYRLREGLDMLRNFVEQRTLMPVLDKVYLPEEFETALAHVCGEDALGDSVVRFP